MIMNGGPHPFGNRAEVDVSKSHACRIAICGLTFALNYERDSFVG